MRNLFKRAKRPGVLLPGLVLLLGAGLSGCGEEPPEAPPVVRPVKLMEVGGAGQLSSREFPGAVSAMTQADVAFEVDGKLVDFPVREAQEVKQGDLIARLDPRDYQAALDSSLARAGAAKAEYSRFQALFDADVASTQELEIAQRNHEMAVANLKTRQKGFDDTRLLAPFDGTISRRLVNDFDNVKAKQPIVQLQTTSALEIVVDIPERDFATLRPGLSIEERNRDLDAVVEISALPGMLLPARLREFATSADPTTRTFPATFTFERPDEFNVLPGMTAKLILRSLPGTAGDGFLVLVQAIVEEVEGEPYVWVAASDTMRVRKVSVSVGEVSGNSILVSSGLESGMLVITSGVHQLREGMEVRRLVQ